MSDMGLNSSIYEQLRIYADRFDCALVKLNSKDTDAAEKARYDIAKTLREISSTEKACPGSRIVFMILQQHLRKYGDMTKSLNTLADALENCNQDSNQIKEIEDIASAIDKECLITGSRTRGHI